MYFFVKKTTDHSNPASNKMTSPLSLLIRGAVFEIYGSPVFIVMLPRCLASNWGDLHPRK